MSSMFKRVLLIFIVMMLGFSVVAEEKTMTLQAGVSIDKVPAGLYGSWRVRSNRISATNTQLFKQNTVDLWNLSRSGNVITLVNPFTGAEASIVVDTVKGKLIKFKKIGDYEGKKLTDIVQLSLEDNSFKGENHLILETVSGGSVVKTEKAVYSLSGEKISGSSINK